MCTAYLPTMGGFGRWRTHNGHRRYRDRCHCIERPPEHVGSSRVIIGEFMSIIDSLGGNASKYRRERGKAIRAIVSEMYSPPRVSAVAKLCPSFGILPGFVFDLTTHDKDGKRWDFDDEEMRARAWAKVRSEHP